MQSGFLPECLTKSISFAGYIKDNFKEYLFEIPLFAASLFKALFTFCPVQVSLTLLLKENKQTRRGKK